jgi:chemotaxis receptor (MCP) glutamine deamidase CheD
MINLSEINSVQPLVILRGEYGIVKGDSAIIASPNAKSGVVLILSDQENKVTAMAHFDSEKNLEENLEEIFASLTKAGANLHNLKCNLIENDKSS